MLRPILLVVQVVSKLHRCPPLRGPVIMIAYIHNLERAWHTNNPIGSFETFLILPCFRNRPKSVFTGALWFNAGTEHPRILCNLNVFPTKKRNVFSRASDTRLSPVGYLNAYTHTGVYIYVYTRMYRHTQTRPRGTHGGNGLFLLLCCAFGRLPLFLHHLLSTAQRVPLSRQFRVLHRGVCTQDHISFMSKTGTKGTLRDRRWLSSAERVFQVSSRCTNR